jgi:superfamily I DNA/RNA helicase
MGRSAPLLADFGNLLDQWQGLRDQTSLISLFDRIIADVGYEPYINDMSEEGNDRWDNVQELRRLAYDFQEKGLTEFLQNLALVSDQDTIPANAAEESNDRPQCAGDLLHPPLRRQRAELQPMWFIIGWYEGLLTPVVRAMTPRRLA